jgi:hypothetical protein
LVWYYYNQYGIKNLPEDLVGYAYKWYPEITDIAQYFRYDIYDVVDGQTIKKQFKIEFMKYIEDENYREFANFIKNEYQAIINRK